MVTIQTYEIWLVNLDPTLGSEIKKTRPCLVVSPNVMNIHLNTVIIIPLTSTLKDYPTRIHYDFQKKKGQFVLDQIRTIDKQRLHKKLGTVDKKTNSKIAKLLEEIFRQ